MSAIIRMPSPSGHLILLLAALFLTACATAPYAPPDFDTASLQAQAQQQEQAGVSVTAAVPGAEQTQAIFGLPLYDANVQPVWLRIENRTGETIRYAPTGTDEEYFSALEVSYMHRKGYGEEGRFAMDQAFHEHAMPRWIEPGETKSGFVFTRKSPGTKSLVVDVFAPDTERSFAFFLPVPGFQPDHAQIDFDALYDKADIVAMDLHTFRDFLASRHCCSDNRNGESTGLPITVAMVGSGEDGLRALLRANWQETDWTLARDDVDPDDAHYLFGRLPDAVFRTYRGGNAERNELQIWLTPWQVDGEAVWAVLVTHFIGQRNIIRETLFGAAFDPDIDDARMYLMQNLWYSHGLRQWGWVRYGEPSSLTDGLTDHTGDGYFTDGLRAVLWVSGTPVAWDQVKGLDWDGPPPPRRGQP